MEKTDIEYVLHCVRNSRVLLGQNELLKVEGLLHSAQMSLEKHLSTIVQQSLSGSDDLSSSPKSCRTCCHNYEDDTKPPCANCFGFVNWERHDF